MRIFILVTALLIGSVCFGQPMPNQKPKVIKQPVIDSMNVKIISLAEFNFYLERINKVIAEQITVADKHKYDAILKELLTIQADAKKKIK